MQFSVHANSSILTCANYFQAASIFVRIYHTINFMNRVLRGVCECVAGCRSVCAMQILNFHGHSWSQLQVLSPHILKIFWTGPVLTGQCSLSMQKNIC